MTTDDRRPIWVPAQPRANNRGCGSRTARGTGDLGSSLFLFPAAMLIVLILGAIAVDLSAVHLAKRQVLDLAASAANDAVTAGLDEPILRATGDYVVDPTLAAEAVERTVAANDPDGRTSVVRVTVGPTPDQVTVELSTTALPVFAPALPGFRAPEVVTGEATATVAKR